MRLRHLGRIAELAAERWDALFDLGCPFTRHAYLKALEDSGSASPDTGWTPCHALLESDDGALLAAAPLYLKAHSWGEFVFDFSWAEASHRAGLAYYPKLVTAVPFTPATGPRVGAVSNEAEALLLAQLADLAKGAGVSGWHGLFFDAAQAERATALASPALHRRHDIQFHWHNATEPYADFASFLATLQRDKRKKIQQERRKVAEAGLRFETRRADEFSLADWQVLYGLYANTYEERGQPPYLTWDFFERYVTTPTSPFRVTVARDGETLVAMALLVEAGDTLYGRHWGAAVRYDGLHFETCYYQGVDYCIRQGLKRYDAGAQGEHKLARGFEPVLMHSLHTLANPSLDAAVAQALRRERKLIDVRFASLKARSAYKRAEGDAS